jgi:membrane-associated PAP2 superfamily phosphatase
VIHPRMMEFLLDGDPPTIELQRGQCCLTHGEHCWSAAEFEATLAWVAKFFSHWPRHVVGQFPSLEGRG